MLRLIVVALSALTLIIAIGLVLLGAGDLTAAVIWVALQAAILLIALLIERGRYHPRVSDGPWIQTAERFEDPTTGRWVIVEYNPQTGERRYVEVTKRRDQG